MKFSDLRQGDKVFILEKDRRTEIPYFDVAQVMNISDPDYLKVPESGYHQAAKMTLMDSVSTYTITVPLDKQGFVSDRMYITPNLEDIIQEVDVQQRRAEAFLNTDRFELIVKNCKEIKARIQAASGGQSSSPAATSNEFAELKQKVLEQDSLIREIHKYLFDNGNTGEK